jgi:hypothetical protein
MRCDLLLLLLCVAHLAACKEDECRGAPAQAQIDVQLDGVAASDIEVTDIILTMNGGKSITRRFAKPAPSFVIVFAEEDRPPRTLAIGCFSYDRAGGWIASGYESVTFSPDACNFLTVVLKPRRAGDGGVDGPRPDGRRPDAGPPDLQRWDRNATFDFRPDQPRPPDKRAAEIKPPAPDKARPPEAKPAEAKAPDAKPADIPRPKPESSKPDVPRPPDTKP